MADALKFVLELVDRMSGPARQATSALRELERALQSVSQKTEALKISLKFQVAGGALRKAVDPAEKARLDQEKAANAAQKLTDKQAALAQKQAEKATALLAKQQAAQEAVAVKAAARQADKLAIVQKKGNAANAALQAHDNAALLPKLPDIPLRLTNKELEQLKQNLRDDKLAVTNLSASMRQLQQASVVDIGTFKLLQAQLQARKNSLAETQRQLVLSGNAAKYGSEGTNRLTTTLRELAEAAGGKGITGLAGRLVAQGESFGELKGKVSELAKGLSEVTGVSESAAAGVIGVGLAASAALVGVAALGAAIGALVFGGAKLALEASDAKHDTLDMLEAMQGSAEAAASTYDSVRDLTRDLALTMNDGQRLAQELASAGITTTDGLHDAIAAIAEVDSVLKGGGAKIQKVFEKAAQSGKFDVNAKKLVGTGVQIEKLYEEISARTGIGVKSLEKQMKAGKVSAEVGIAALSSVIEKKFGDVARRQALDLGPQFARLKGNISNLFADVDTDRFLTSLSSIVDVFDDATGSGEIMKGVVTDLFDGFFNFADEAVPYVRIALKGLLNVALSVLVGLKPLLGPQGLGLIGPTAEKQQPGIKLLGQAFMLLGRGARMTAEAIAAILNTGIVGWVGKAVLAVTGFANIVPAILFGIGAAVLYVVGHFGQLVQGAKQKALEMFAVGAQFVDGLIEGIGSRVAALSERVKAIAHSVVDAFKRIWDTHSPSRVMEGLGVNLTLGLARGIPKGSPAANQAMQRAVALPRLPANDNALAPVFHLPTPAAAAPIAAAITARSSQPPQDANRSAAGGGPTQIHMHVERGAVTFMVSGGVDEIKDRLAEVLADALEQAAIQSGLAPTGTS